MILERTDVLAKIGEYDRIGEEEFLAKYASGRNSRTIWIRHNGKRYPAKAICAAAHRPILKPSKFNPSDVFPALKRIDIQVGLYSDDQQAAQNFAIDDINQLDIGNDDPEYKKRMAGVYIRDDRVRRKVLKRAQGVCEFEGCIPFVSKNGKPYLEAHHVISLSAQGCDLPNNVIALCANHHREAHSGERWKTLNDNFLKLLKKIRS